MKLSLFPSFSAMAFYIEIGKADEVKSDRKFGGCSFVSPPVRDIPANMRVTAKQIRYNGGKFEKYLNTFRIPQGSITCPQGVSNTMPCLSGGLTVWINEKQAGSGRSERRRSI